MGERTAHEVTGDGIDRRDVDELGASRLLVDRRHRAQIGEPGHDELRDRRGDVRGLQRALEHARGLRQHPCASSVALERDARLPLPGDVAHDRDDPDDLAGGHAHGRCGAGEHELAAVVAPMDPLDRDRLAGERAAHERHPVVPPHRRLGDLRRDAAEHLVAGYPVELGRCGVARGDAEADVRGDDRVGRARDQRLELRAVRLGRALGRDVARDRRGTDDATRHVAHRRDGQGDGHPRAVAVQALGDELLDVLAFEHAPVAARRARPGGPAARSSTSAARPPRAPRIRTAARTRRSSR